MGSQNNGNWLRIVEDCKDSIAEKCASSIVCVKFGVDTTNILYFSDRVEAAKEEYEAALTED